MISNYYLNCNMAVKEFQIEFSYQDMPYIGLVNPIQKGKETWYAVNLESENQETYVEIIAKPSVSALEDWDFECKEGESAVDYYDKDLLQEIGEAIEKHTAEGFGFSRPNEEEL
jgi:hypothetical protein